MSRFITRSESLNLTTRLDWFKVLENLKCKIVGPPSFVYVCGLFVHHHPRCSFISESVTTPSDEICLVSPLRRHPSTGDFTQDTVPPRTTHFWTFCRKDRFLRRSRFRDSTPFHDLCDLLVFCSGTPFSSHSPPTSPVPTPLRSILSPPTSPV